MSSEVSPVTVSTDIGGGIRPILSDVLSIYKEAGYNCQLEIILTPITLFYLGLMARGNMEMIPVRGVHGMMGQTLNPFAHQKGVKDWVFATGIDWLILPEPKSKVMLSTLNAGEVIDKLAKITDVPIYYNIHNRIAKTKKKDYLSWATHADKAYLTIENGISRGDVNNTIAMVKYFREKGAEKTKGLFDLLHAVVEKSGGVSIGDTSKYWGQILSVIDSNQDIFRHLHIPIGINGDSLPIAEMINEKAMLKDLVQLILKLGIEVTFENQHDTAFGVENRDLEVNRVRGIRDVFNKHGLGI